MHKIYSNKKQSGIYSYWHRYTDTHIYNTSIRKLCIVVYFCKYYYVVKICLHLKIL